MKEIAIEISASVVAWYAAIVATAALAIHAWAAWRDRARVVVTAKAGMRVIPGARAPYDHTKEYILINVANLGRRPCTIEKVGLKLRSSDGPNHLLATDSAFKGPQELTEGRSSHWLARQDQVNLDNVEYVWAYDATGKEYRGKLKRN